MHAELDDFESAIDKVSRYDRRHSRRLYEHFLLLFKDKVRGAIAGDHIRKLLNMNIRYADLFFISKDNKEYIVEFKLSLTSGESLYDHNPFEQAKGLFQMVCSLGLSQGNINGVFIVVHSTRRRDLKQIVLMFTRDVLRLRGKLDLNASLLWSRAYNVINVVGRERRPVKVRGLPGDPSLYVVDLGWG